MVKVIVLGTGSISSIAVRCMFDRSDFEVIGVWAHEETAGNKVEQMLVCCMVTSRSGLPSAIISIT